MVTLDEFFARYEIELCRAVSEYPDEYMYGIEQVPDVIGRMRAAFIAGSYNKDSRAIKATCKAFGIKHTYTAIRESVEGAGR